MATKMTDHIAGLVESALESRANSDDFVWDAALSFNDGEPIVAVVMGMKGPLLGTMLWVQGGVRSPQDATEDDIAPVVHNLVEALHTRSSEVLAQSPETT